MSVLRKGLAGRWKSTGPLQLPKRSNRLRRWRGCGSPSCGTHRRCPEEGLSAWRPPLWNPGRTRRWWCAGWWKPGRTPTFCVMKWASGRQSKQGLHSVLCTCPAWRGAYSLPRRQALPNSGTARWPQRCCFPSAGPAPCRKPVTSIFSHWRKTGRRPHFMIQSWSSCQRACSPAGNGCRP